MYDGVLYCDIDDIVNIVENKCWGDVLVVFNVVIWGLGDEDEDDGSNSVDGYCYVLSFDWVII